MTSQELWDLLNPIASIISDNASWVRDRLNEARDSLGGTIHNNAEWVRQRVEETRNDIGRAIGDNAQWVFDSVRPLLAALGDAIGANASWVTGQLAPLISAVQSAVGSSAQWVADQLAPRVDQLFGAITDNAQWIFDALGPKFDDVRDQIVSNVEWLRDTVLPQLASIGQDIGDNAQWIMDQMAPELSGVTAAIGSNAQWVVDTLTERVGSLLPDPSELLTAVLGGLANFVDGFQGALADTDDFWDGLFSNIVGWISGSNDAVATGIREHLLPGWLGASTFYSEEAAAGTVDLLSALTPQSPGPRTPREVLDMLENAPGPQRVIINLAVAVLMAFSELQAASQASAALFSQAGMLELQPTPLSPAELAAGVEQQRIGLEFAREEAKLSGLSEGRFDTLVGITGQPPAPETALELWRRGVFTEAQTLQAIRESTLKSEYAEPVFGLRYHVIPPADLVRLMVRDALDERVVDEQQLDTDFRTKYNAELFNAVGMSEEQARFLWRAHWRYPSPTELYNMLHRDIITEDQARELLKIDDWAPAQIDNIMALSFHPYTRVDIRRMHKDGVLTDTELERAYMELGYDTERAARLSAWTVKLNHKDTESAGEIWRAPLKTRVLSLYLDWAITEDQAREALAGLDFTEAQADALIADAGFAREASLTRQARESIRKAFTTNLLDEQLTADKLASVGYGLDSIGELMAAWTFEREFRELTDSEREQRDLTKTEVLEAYATRLLSVEQTKDALLQLHYDELEAETMIALANARRIKAENKLAQDAARALYTANKIARNDAIMRLDQIGMPAAQRDLLIEQWSVEREVKLPELPVSAIEDLMRRHIIQEADASAELRRHGFDDRQIDWWLKLWGARRQASATSHQQRQA